MKRLNFIFNARMPLTITAFDGEVTGFTDTRVSRPAVEFYGITDTGGKTWYFRLEDVAMFTVETVAEDAA